MGERGPFASTSALDSTPVRWLLRCCQSSLAVQLTALLNPTHQLHRRTRVMKALGVSAHGTGGGARIAPAIAPARIAPAFLTHAFHRPCLRPSPDGHLVAAALESAMHKWLDALGQSHGTSLTTQQRHAVATWNGASI